MLGEANNFSSEINQTQFPALTELNLIEIRTIIANSQASLNAELSTFEPQNISENDKTLLRIGQPDVNYAFTDTLEQSGINHINIDTISLENPRSALTEIYQTGDNLLREQGLPSPNIEFYHKAAKQAQESDQNIQDVLTEMRNSHPLMMRADLDPPETIRSLPEGEFTQAQVQNFTLGQAAENNNTSGLQTSAVGDFKGDTNYCSRSAPDINLKNHGPNGKLVHATDDLISIYPRAGSVPHATIPNTVGADGFSTWALNDHVYNVYTDTRGMGLRQMLWAKHFETIQPQVMTIRLRQMAHVIMLARLKDQLYGITPIKVEIGSILLTYPLPIQNDLQI